MLVDAVRRATLPPRATALDLCTGSGAVAVAVAQRGVRSVTAVDTHRRSTWAAQLNARINGVRVRGLQGDLFEPVAGRRFDLITANPPYLPVPPDSPLQRGDRAWNAGENGRAVIDRIIERLPEHLAPGGSVLLVQSSITGTRETLEHLSDVSRADDRRTPARPAGQAPRRAGRLPHQRRAPARAAAGGGGPRHRSAVRSRACRPAVHAVRRIRTGFASAWRAERRGLSPLQTAAEQLPPLIAELEAAGDHELLARSYMTMVTAAWMRSRAGAAAEARAKAVEHARQVDDPGLLAEARSSTRSTR